MKRIIKRSLIVLALALLCLVPSLILMAQDKAPQHGSGDSDIETNGAASHRKYILKDLGTLGGPGSSVSFLAKSVNNRGTVAGTADTSNPDPFDPNCFGPNCFVQHAFKWEDGIKTDLGTLPGGSSSASNWINDSGQVAGQSQNGLIDPLTGAPASSPVVWTKNGQIINLGTLGGDQGLAVAINNGGRAVGAAANTIPDPFSLANIFNLGFATQTRAFLWEHGKMRDLGTLGGPDSFAFNVNDRGQVAGISYIDSTPNDTTGLPTIHPFIWDDDKMVDLGGFGGSIGIVDYLNNRGQVVGLMTLPGDESQHPFFWEKGRLRDLGTFGGSNGEATWLNDAGEIVGVADFPGDLLHNAFLWKKGVMTDLGNLGKSSTAYSINSKGQIVGASRVKPGDIRAFLWEHNGPMIDLNTRIPAGSSLQLVYALSINDRGEIAGIGVPPGVASADVESLGHAFLLIPDEGDHAESTVNADSGPVRQDSDIRNVDNEAAAPAPRRNAETDRRVGSLRARQVNENPMRSSRLSLGRARD